jgi:hypothetical protein
LFKGYGAKVGLGNMRVKAENRMVTSFLKRVNFQKVLPYLFFPYRRCLSEKKREKICWL